MNTLLITLIISYAQVYKVDPKLAVSVAKVESGINPKAVGPVGEVGIFQVRPEYSKYTAAQLKDPTINIKEGLRILVEAREQCKHKEDKSWLVCYNAGVAGGNRIKHPKKFRYYKQVMNEYALR